MILSPEVHLVAGREHREPIELVTRSLLRMPPEIVAVRVSVDARQERRSRLACARISLRYALAGGGQIPIVADGEVNEVVQLVTAKSAVPVLGGPGSARTRSEEHTSELQSQSNLV